MSLYLDIWKFHGLIHAKSIKFNIFFLSDINIKHLYESMIKYELFFTMYIHFRNYIYSFNNDFYVYKYGYTPSQQ